MKTQIFFVLTLLLAASTATNHTQEYDKLYSMIKELTFQVQRLQDNVSKLQPDMPRGTDTNYIATNPTNQFQVNPGGGLTTTLTIPTPTAARTVTLRDAGASCDFVTTGPRNQNFTSPLLMQKAVSPQFTIQNTGGAGTSATLAIQGSTGATPYTITHNALANTIVYSAPPSTSTYFRIGGNNKFSVNQGAGIRFYTNSGGTTGGWVQLYTSINAQRTYTFLDGGSDGYVMTSTGNQTMTKYNGAVYASYDASNGRVNLGNPTSTKNTLNVAGGATISGGTTISGGSTITGGATIGNGATITGGATVSGSVTFNNDITVTSYSTFNNGLQVNGAVGIGVTTLGFDKLVQRATDAPIYIGNNPLTRFDMDTFSATLTGPCTSSSGTFIWKKIGSSSVGYTVEVYAPVGGLTCSWTTSSSLGLSVALQSNLRPASGTISSGPFFCYGGGDDTKPCFATVTTSGTATFFTDFDQSSFVTNRIVGFPSSECILKYFTTKNA